MPQSTFSLWDALFKEDIIGEYTIVLPKLANYIAEIHTHGNKKNKSLFTHVLNGVFNIMRICKLLNVDSDISKLMILSYTIHDMNKFPEYKDISLRDCATKENIIKKIKELRLDEYFPKYEEYINEIVTLIRGHSSKYTNAENLLFADPGYKLTKQEVEDYLLPFIQAIDALDVYNDLLDNRTEILIKINKFTSYYAKIKFKFVYHYISENRGILTNLLHYQVIKYLEQYNVYPFLYYPDGVLYLTEETNKLSFINKNTLYEKIAKETINFIKKQNKQLLSNAVKGSSNGITINQEVLKSGVDFSDLFNAILSETENETKFKKVNEKHFKENPLRKLAKKRKKLSDEEFIKIEKFIKEYTPNQSYDVIKMARLLQAVKNTISTIQKILKKNSSDKDLWEKILNLFNLPYESFYEFYDGIHAIPILVANKLIEHNVSYNSIKEKLKKLLKQYYDSVSEIKEEAFDFFKEYLENFLFISFLDKEMKVSTKTFEKFSSGKRERCSLCGAIFKANKLISDECPNKNIKVKNFSNREKSGKPAPYRLACPICKYQLILQKNSFNIKSTIFPDILYIEPQGFFPDYMVNCFKNLCKEIYSKNDEFIDINIKNIDQENVDIKNVIMNEKIWQFSSRGLSVSKFEDGLLNTSIPLQINLEEGNTTEKTLLRFEKILLISIFISLGLNVKVIHSTTVIPPIAPYEVETVYFDFIPELFKGVVKKNLYSYDELKNIKSIYLLLLSLINNLKIKKKYPIVEAMKYGPLEVLYETGKTLKKDHKFNKDISRFVINVVEKLDELLKNDERKEVGKLSYIKKLAQKARNANLKGESFNDYALAKPLDICKENCVKWNNSWASVEDLKAICIQEIFDHLERIRSRKNIQSGKTLKNSIEDFVNYFVDEIFIKLFNQNDALLEREFKKIRKAYIFYLSSLYSKKEENEK